MTDPRDPEPIPDVRNDPVPEPVRTEPLPGEDPTYDPDPTGHQEENIA